MVHLSHGHILDEIRELFDWNPPLLSPDTPDCPPVIKPSSFYYEHLDERLLLKEVIPFPSLVTNLSTTIDRVLEVVEREIVLTPLPIDHPFPTAEYREMMTYNDSIVDANSVALAYQSTTADYCGLIASMLFLSPKSPSWETFLVWLKGEESARDNPGLDETFVLQIANDISDPAVPNDAWDTVEEDIRSTLLQRIIQFPVLARWEIFAITPDNEALLKAISEPQTQKTRQRDGTHMETMALPGVLPHLMDATTLPWGTLMTSLVEKPIIQPSTDAPETNDPGHPPRRSSRTRKRLSTKEVNKPSAGATKAQIRDDGAFPTITLPTRESRTAEDGESLPKHLLKQVRCLVAFSGYSTTDRFIGMV
jgi:hypothetical protein